MKSLPSAEQPIPLEIEAVGAQSETEHLPWLEAEVEKRKQIERKLEQLERELDEYKRMEHQLYQLAYYDDLTSLPNRLYFSEQLHALLMDEDATAHVFVVDIDRFKKFNDNLGHENGNALLRAIAKRFSKAVPEPSLLCRYGGDEFAIMSSGLTRKMAASIADDILKSLKQSITIVGNNLRVTTSIGLSHYPTMARNIPELMRQADTAMYRAKKNGGNSCSVYDVSWGPSATPQRRSMR